MHLIKHNTCRVCGSNALTPVISLGDQYLQGSFVKPGKEMPPTRKISTSLVRCDPMRDEKACGLLQMEYTIPPEVLYSAYWYRSGTNNTMRRHLQGIVEEVMGMTGLKESVLVLDIGCNDGTLLGFYPDSFTKFGVDPSDVAQEIKAPVNIVQDIFPSEELISRLDSRTFDIITSIAMYYDLEDPIAFTRGIKQILSPEGIWVFEMSYMPTMLKMTSYDTICHEHIEYYSLAVIEYILKQAGMKVVNVSLNDINGGSLRCHATHISNFTYKLEEFQQHIKAMRQEEFDLELDTDKPYRHFQERVNVHREELKSLLKKFKKEGKKIHIYGASTKGNTILQWCGIDHKIIDCAAERNPDKYGAMTLGTDIPIVSEEESRSMNPDYYLVLPWHFKEEFLDRERETLERGIGLIFPLPTIEIIHK
jgi:SAM-dependent methyltransferase